MRSFLTQKKGFFRHLWLVFYLIILTIIAVAGWFTTGYLGERARQEILKDNESAITVLSIHLTDELNKMEGAVKALSGSPFIAPALITRKEEDVARASVALDWYTSALDASVSYLMDETGMTIASSNRNDPDSFVGKSYQFRPYFTKAIKGNPGRYFALGVTSLKRGFYASIPVRGNAGNIVGVVTVKKDLDDIEKRLSSYPYFFFINPDGVIFLSSKKDLLLKSLWPVSREIEQSLISSRQFGDKPFEALMSKETADGMHVVFKKNDYLVSRRTIDLEGWSVVIMTPTDRIMAYKSAGTIMTILLCTLMIVPLIVNYKTVRSAEVVRKSEERFHRLADSTFEGIVIHDEGKILDFNQSLQHMLGYEHDEIIGNNIMNFIAPESREFPLMNTQADYEKPYEIILQKKEGTNLVAEVAGKQISYKGKTASVVTLHNISARKGMEEERTQSLERLRKALGATVQAMAMAVETRDPYTTGHQRRVADLARAIATEMRLSVDIIDGIRMAGIIHDIGKIVVPAEILSKPTKLTDKEFDLIKVHPKTGYDILKDIEFPWPVAQVILQHHERLNGSGYPHALTGENILKEARILAVADVVEATASHRPYRSALGIDEGLKEIVIHRGVLYDPEVVDVCLKLFKEKGFRFR